MNYVSQILREIEFANFRVMKNAITLSNLGTVCQLDI